METFFVDFINQTDRTWTMGIYQELPNAGQLGIDAVSWKQVTTPMSGTGGVTWDETYNVALAELQSIGGRGVYRNSQLLQANLGTTWEVVFKDGVQQLEFVGTATPGTISILNNSNLTANPGVGQAGSASAFKSDVLSGTDANFTFTPTYFVGLFNNVELGTIIDSNVTVGPLVLAFTGGANHAVFTASLGGPSGQDLLLDIVYGNRTSLSCETVNNRIKADNQRIPVSV